MKMAQLAARFGGSAETLTFSGHAFNLFSLDERWNYVDYDVKIDDDKNVVYVQIPCLTFEYAMHAGALFGCLLDVMGFYDSAPDALTMEMLEMEFAA